MDIACTLDSGAAKQRWQEWGRLEPTAKLVHADAGHLQFRFPLEAESELTRLVELERACCGYVDWRLQHRDDGVILTISGERLGIEAIALQFGLDPAVLDDRPLPG
jgi:hypothetical protein